MGRGERYGSVGVEEYRSWERGANSMEDSGPKREKSQFARSFRDLEVYQSALDLVVAVHRLCGQLPVEERFVLADHMRRASHSVCQNIAEAWRKRRYKAAFVSKLSDSETEAGEMQSCLDLALRLGYIQEDLHAELDRRYETVIGQLVTMIANADRWCKLAGR